MLPIARTLTLEKLPKCEGLVSKETMRWREYIHKDNPKCTYKATFEIRGHYYCTRHAGQVALAILLEPRE